MSARRVRSPRPTTPVALSAMPRRRHHLGLLRPPRLTSTLLWASVTVATLGPALPGLSAGREPVQPDGYMGVGQEGEPLACPRPPSGHPSDASPPTATSTPAATVTSTPAPAPTPTPYRPPGVDLSHWNAGVSFSALKAAGIAFAFAKASQGTTMVDTDYPRYLAGASREGLYFGPYHFFDYTRDGLAQAEHFIATVEANGGFDGLLPPVVDVECLPGLDSPPRAYARGQLRALVDELYARTGRRPIIYTSAQMWSRVLGTDTSFGADPLWVACWGCTMPVLPSGWSRWTYWQDGSSRFDGIPSRIGTDVYRGTPGMLARQPTRLPRIERGAPFATTRQVTMELTGRDGAVLRSSLDGVAWSDWRPYERLATFTLGADDGSQTLQVQLADERGVTAPIVADTITLDTTPPALTGPALAFRLAPLGTADRPFPVSVTWDASDATSGLAPALLSEDCGDGSVVVTGIGQDTDRFLPDTGTCTFSIHAADVAGHEASSARTVTVTAIDDAPSDDLSYSGTWRDREVVGAWGAGVHSTSGRSRGSASLVFEGSAAAIVSSMGPARGRARIFLDGVRVGMVDLYAPAPSGPAVVFSVPVAEGRAHVLEVRVLGTRHPDAGGSRVDIDAFLVMSR